jgi:2-amino-4-hydroxy-6-hydroxymethyldihydropteridine diphosphokinase
MVDCYVGLGGNEENTLPVMRRVIGYFKQVAAITDFKCSRLFSTTPVSDLPQPHYLNAACRFHTAMPIDLLWNMLKNLTFEMGQLPKPKNAPRLIDLDLLFYGTSVEYTEQWIIPHPRWHERLFVIQPLADVTDELPFGLKMEEILAQFSNPHREKILAIQERLLDHALD